LNNPQKENGYTPISNELLEVIYKSKFNATQLKILLIVCRYTYGFSRKEHSISESFIAKGINISKRYISNELNNLIKQKVIKVIKSHTDTTAKILGLNKHYDEWEGRTILQQVNNTSTGEQYFNTTVEQLFIPPVEQYFNTTVEQLFIPPVEQLFHQENKSLKQNIKQSLKQNIKQDIELFFESVWKLYPNKKGKAQISDTNKKELQKVGFEILQKCIDRYVRTKETWKAYQNGSTFFNSGYVDYLDENFEEPPSQGNKPKTTSELLIEKIKKMEDENGQDTNNEIITDVEYSISKL
jgi:phage replication O-like protein O